MALRVDGQHLSVDDRLAQGRQARSRVAPGTHGDWQPSADRPDPVAVLEGQDAVRDPDLVPIRHGRMAVSPFTFYRGTAGVMAADLAATPCAGLDVQLSGDAHLSNFGAYASPERELVFDLNDFDETLPGPFEWDVKRLAASFAVAGRNNKFGPDDVRRAAKVVGRAYREGMANFARSATVDVWYAHLSVEDLKVDLARATKRRLSVETKDKKRLRSAEAKKVAAAIARGEVTMRKARARTSLQAMSQLTEVVDGRQRIVSQPPILVPFRELGALYGVSDEELSSLFSKEFQTYRSSLSYARRHLLDRFEVVDLARKVVGVGSVGTRAFAVLLEGRDARDPLFLQVKQARRSVLEDHLPPSEFATPSQRVVEGMQLMQAVSDIFVGWSGDSDPSRSFYWRQLRDMKTSADVESMTAQGMIFYARICGWTLARSHARSGDPVAITAYLGSGSGFDQAMAEFAVRYADQNDRDYREFRKAIKSGRLKAIKGV